MLRHLAQALVILMFISEYNIIMSELDLPIDVQKRFLESWINAKGFSDITCADVHPGTSCAYEISKRFGVVAKNTLLLYAALHFIPFFLLKMKTLRNKSKKQVLHSLLKLLKRYLGSIAFMSTLVAICKATICSRTWITYTPFSELKEAYSFWMMIGAVVSGVTLFFQQGTRKNEIALHAFIRSLPALYTRLARRKMLYIPHVGEITFVVVFALLSMCYHSLKSNMNYSVIFEKIWGDH